MSSSINISEQLLTQSVTAVGTDIPFIPGFTVQEPKDGNKSLYNIPVLCTTIRDFERYFGACPKKLSISDTKNAITTSDYDRSYIMAKELLKVWRWDNRCILVIVSKTQNLSRVFVK